MFLLTVFVLTEFYCILSSCGNVAAIFMLDELLENEFKLFEAAPQVTIPIVPLTDKFLTMLYLGGERRPTS